MREMGGLWFPKMLCITMFEKFLSFQMLASSAFDTALLYKLLQKKVLTY